MTEQEFVAAVEAHRPLMLQLVARRSREPEEVVQETLAELVEVYPHFTPNPAEPDHVRKWLLTALWFRLMREYRERRQTRAVDPERFARHLKHDGDAAEIEQEEALLRMWDSLERLLTREWYERFLLLFRDGVPQTVLARKLGMTRTNLQRVLYEQIDYVASVLNPVMPVAGLVG